VVRGCGGGGVGLAGGRVSSLWSGWLLSPPSDYPAASLVSYLGSCCSWLCGMSFFFLSDSGSELGEGYLIVWKSLTVLSLWAERDRQTQVDVFMSWSGVDVAAAREREEGGCVRCVALRLSCHTCNNIPASHTQPLAQNGR
jgi:hypothetical protein